MTLSGDPSAVRSSSGLVGRILPDPERFRGISPRTMRADLFAGLTGAVIVLPQGVAFAIIAGLPPEYGLYCAIVPAIVAALFGSSLHLISGPTTAISIVVAGTVAPLAPPGSPAYLQLVLTLTFLAGAFQLALGLARLGALTNFVSHSVVVGFTAGAAVLIATSQVPHALGIPGGGGAPFLAAWAAIARGLPDANPHVVAVAAATLLVAALLRRLRPRWPGMLVALAGGSLLSAAIDGAAHGVRLLGSLPGRLPPLSHPDLTADAVRLLGSGALAVALLGLTEAVSIARSVAARSHQRVDSNREFVGQGISNIVGSFFSGYASSGSFTRTGVNYDAGARTPLAGVFAAIFLAAILLLVAPLTAYLPIPAMAGLLVLVAWNLVDTRHIGHILRVSRGEAAVLVVTFLATLFVQLELAVYAGVILSLVLYLNRTAHPTFVTVVPDPESPRRTLVNVAKKPLPECPQLKIVRIDGSIFFGAVDHVAQGFDAIARESPLQAHILVVGAGVNFIDLAGCEMLNHEARRLRVNGRLLYLCSLKGEAREILHRGGCIAGIGAGNVFASKADALRGIVPRLDPERCRTCRLRIFRECAGMPGPPDVPPTTAR